MELINVYLEVFASIVVFFLMNGCIQFKQIFNYASSLFIRMQVWNITMLLCDALTWGMIYRAHQGHSISMMVLEIAECGIYISYYMMMRTFICYLISMMKSRVAVGRWVRRITDVVCFFSSLLWCISAYNGIVVSVTPDGLIIGKLYWLGQVGGYICVILILYIIIAHWKALGKDAYILLSFVVFPLAASLLRSVLPKISLMDLAMTLSTVLIYNFVHVGAARVAKQHEVDLGETQMKLMTSQIQPHFIFNSLNTIYYLVEKDPALAQTAISTFSDYLRVNIESLKSTDLIPFSKELEHVQSYLSLEKMRFDDEIEIQYEIHADQFMVPSLSLQPMVENAVKHGIGKKTGGGIVTIRSYEDDECIYIEVEDNGVGFDMSRIKEASGMDHAGVGIENVRRRLKSSCDGRVEIESIEGEGTKVRLILPKENTVQNILLES
ncbi:MAG: histidine kinase [Lachnospiraceae bacterium]|nr:histidine kinase [Lachnospiraceae bacterium]